MPNTTHTLSRPASTCPNSKLYSVDDVCEGSGEQANGWSSAGKASWRRWSDSKSWQAACVGNRLRGEEARPLQVALGRAARLPPGGGRREAEVTGIPLPPLPPVHLAVLPPLSLLSRPIRR